MLGYSSLSQLLLEQFRACPVTTSQIRALSTCPCPVREHVRLAYRKATFWPCCTCSKKATIAYLNGEWQQWLIFGRCDRTWSGPDTRLIKHGGKAALPTLGKAAELQQWMPGTLCCSRWRRGGVGTSEPLETELLRYQSITSISETRGTRAIR